MSAHTAWSSLQTNLYTAARTNITSIVTMSDFGRAVEALRPQLLRFAQAQLKNDAWAEDAVSDTLLAALEKPLSFSGQSQLKTWLVGILKHKVIDQIRRHSREMASTPEDDEDLDALLFLPDGHWREAPKDWGNPEASLGEQQFFTVLEACMASLPGQQGRLFMMREWLEFDTDEICKELGISPTNVWVMLHRARLRLQACLQSNWFSARTGSLSP